MPKLFIVPTQGIAQRERKRLLAAIHQAKRDLGLDDNLYRDILQEATGQRSAALLSIKELEIILDFFRSRGWRDRSKSPASQHLPPEEKPPKSKAIALWINLYKDGLIPDGSHRALQLFALKAMGEKARRAALLPGVDPLDALTPTQLNRLINQLRQIRKRLSDPKVQINQPKNSP